MGFKNHKLIKRWPYLATIFALLLFVPIKIMAVSPLVKLLVQPIWSYYVWPLTWALQLEMELLRLVARYNNFTSEGGVTLGWIALRDLSNMFFILILLVIAFASILRISNYGYQQLLKKTLIVAILINFSKTIVGFMIDIVQVVMLTFISAIDEIMAGGVVVAIGLHKLTQIQLPGDGVPMDDYIVALVMGGIFLGILVVVMGVMVMMLMMRIVALWVAIVLAPLAFVASIFPSTKSFYSRWIKELGTNLVTGPMLAFFMWLTFSIVGNGEAYRTFLNSDPSIPGPTEFLGTANMVNYIIAISLLLMGIKMSASSGAAGASFAAKGMGMINNTASKFARRYPMAAGKRFAGWAAGGFVRDKGEARSLQTGLNRIINSRVGQRIGLTRAAGSFNETAANLQESDNRFARLGGRTMAGIRDTQWNRIPFYGGRVQRGAMKAQGVRSAMIDEFQSADEKNINPKQKEEFERSQDALRGGPRFLGRVPILNRSRFLRDLGLGDVAGGVTSLGGNLDRRFMANKIKLERQEIDTAEQASEAYESFDRINYQPGTDKLENVWAHTIPDKEQAVSQINEHGAAAVIRAKRAEGLHGEGAQYLFEALMEDKNIAGGEMGKLIAGLPKPQKAAWSKVLEEYRARLLAASPEEREKWGDLIESEINPETGETEVEENNKGVISTRSQHPVRKLLDIGNALYPDQITDVHTEAKNIMENELVGRNLSFSNHSVANIPKGSTESDEHYQQRLAQIKVDWEANNAEYDASDKGEEATRKRNIKRRQLKGIYTPEEIEREQASIEGSTLPDKEKAKKIEQLYESPLAKFEGNENDIQTALLLNRLIGDGKLTREAIVASLDKIATGATSKRLNVINTIELPAALARGADGEVEVARLMAEQNTLMRLQNSQRRDALGFHLPNSKNVFSRGLLKESTDGTDFSRLQEMNINVESNRHLFIELAKVATQDQQRQLLQEGNPDQIKLFAESVVSTGQKLNKAIVDNLPPLIKEDIFKKMWMMKFLAEGKSHADAEAEVAKKSGKDLSEIK